MRPFLVSTRAGMYAREEDGNEIYQYNYSTTCDNLDYENDEHYDKINHAHYDNNYDETYDEL